MLSYANSMLNPILYAAFNENLRVGFARACRCLAAERESRGCGWAVWTTFCCRPTEGLTERVVTDE